LIPKEYGTRHRAAVGISEVTDALTIVVSEETGGVMITRNSEMLQELTQEDYLKYLRRALVQPETPQRNGIQEFIDGIIKGGTRK
jgi:diadenylate cyclase